MVLLACPVPAGDGRAVALQGSLSLGHHLRDRRAFSFRVRLLFDAVPGCDDLFRGDRSGGGSGAVVGRTLGRGGVAHLRYFNGRRGGLVSAGLWRKHTLRSGRDRVARHVSVAGGDGGAGTAGVNAFRNEREPQWQLLASSGSAIWDCPWPRIW